MKKFLKFWVLVLVWMGFIFFLSSIPDLKSGLKQDFILRKIAHMLEFAVLTFLLLRAFSAQGHAYRQAGGPASGWKKNIIYSLIFSVFYALTDEYHQTFISGRQGALKDVGIDSIGILIVSLIWYIRNRNICLSKRKVKRF